ncbi:ABC transporter permease [Embleya sp. NPDC008237]|uniref:ABC transporter permease n=1 Tax=Embleya sp. NPDC008237 TaxID=3363978 RepID=UPI0036E7A46D
MHPPAPARTIVGQHATEEHYHAVRDQLGLNDSLPEQYRDWLAGVAHGDLGSSLFSGESVTAMPDSRIPVSLSLILTGTAVSGVAGVTLGILSARRGGPLVKAVDVLSLLGLAVPAFRLALVLIAVPAVEFGWFPVTGYVFPADDPVEWGRSLALPVLSLSLGAVAVISK